MGLKLDNFYALVHIHTYTNMNTLTRATSAIEAYRPIANRLLVGQLFGE